MRLFVVWSIFVTVVMPLSTCVVAQAAPTTTSDQVSANGSISGAVTTSDGVPIAQPLYFCCSALNTGFHQTNELAKIRFNITQQTALTVSYLGGADRFDNSGATLQNFTGGGINFFNFVPPAGSQALGH